MMVIIMMIIMMILMMMIMYDDTDDDNDDDTDDDDYTEDDDNGDDDRADILYIRSIPGAGMHAKTLVDTIHHIETNSVCVILYYTLMCHGTCGPSYTRNDHIADRSLYPTTPRSTLSRLSVILSRWPMLRHTLHIHHWSGR